MYPIIENNNMLHVSYEDLRYLEGAILIPFDNNYIGAAVEPEFTTL